MSNLMTSASAEASVSSSRRAQTTASIYPQQLFSQPNQPQPPPKKKKRNLPGNPDPDAEVIALSPKSLLATNRFVCEICGKGFQRDQNLQLHRRGHNLPWKLKQRTGKEVRKKVYVCPEAGCVHHHPSRALGDLTGIKKHFSRKHGEKKWKCEKCSKRYAVQSDWKAHSKTCGTREYRCDCGTLFSRRDSFITHRAFCDALAEESTRAINTAATLLSSADPSFHVNHQLPPHFGNGSGHAFSMKREQHNFGNMPPWLACPGAPPPLLDHVGSSLFSPASLDDDRDRQLAATRENPNPSLPPYQPTVVSPQMSATALLQKAARMGASMSTKTGALPVMMRPHHQPLPHVSAGSANNTTGFGLNLSTPEEMASGFVSVSGSASFGNKAALSSGLPDHTGAGAGAGSGASAPPLLQDVMMTSFSSPTGFGGSSSGGILMNSKKDLNVPGTTLSHRIIGMADNHEVGDASTGTSSDAMTRDFLGLRSLSRSHILNMAALANCITPPHHNQNHNQNPTQKSWQGTEEAGSRILSLRDS